MRILLLGLLLTSALWGMKHQEFAKKFGYETNYEVALKKAKAQKKDIMFVMVANFCPWCKKFEKKVLTKKKVDTQIQKKYIPLILNREEKLFPKELDVPLIPTMYFISYENEKIKEKIVGYNNRQDFLNIINE